MHGSGDEPILFKALQRQREHALRDAFHGTMDFVVSQGSAARQGANDHHRPFIADARQQVDNWFAVFMRLRLVTHGFVRFTQACASLCHRPSNLYITTNILFVKTICSVTGVSTHSTSTAERHLQYQGIPRNMLKRPMCDPQPETNPPMSQRTLFINACLLTLSEKPLAPGAHQILVEDGRIAAIGRDLGVSAEVPTIDAQGGIVMPGMIDTHRHVWQSLLRAQLADGSLYDYMAKLRYGFAPHFSAEDAQLGNYAGALDALNAGVTTVVDHSHVIATPEHADALLTGLESTGIRAVFCYGLSDVADAGVPIDTLRAYNSTWRHQDAERLRKERLSAERGRIRFGIGASEFLFAPLHYTATEVALARQLGAHRFSIHAANGPFARGTRYVTRLLAKGLVDDRTLFVHGNVLTRHDLGRMKDLGATLAVTPESEMQMGMGTPNWPLAKALGVSCGLGADIVSGGSGDLFTQMRLALAAGRMAANDRLGARGIMPGTLSLTAEDALRAVTIEAARVAGLENEVGSIEVGKRADLIMLRAAGAHLAPIVDPVATVVMQASVADIDLVMLDGRVIKSGGQLVGVDQSALALKMQRAAERIVKATTTESVAAAYAHMDKAFPLNAVSAFVAKVAGKALQIPGLDQAMFKLMNPKPKSLVNPSATP